MNQISLFLAWRYFVGSKKDRSVFTMIIVCFLGISIGSCALALVASVMNGFEKMTHEKMQGIHSQIIIHAEGQEIDPQAIGTVFKDEFPEVKSFSPHGYGQAIIQNETSQTIHDVVLIKGIDPKTEKQISVLEDKIVHKPTEPAQIEKLIHGNKVMIGERLAKIVELKPGDPIVLFIAKNNSLMGSNIKLKQKKAIISAIFKTGIDEYDNGLIVCSLPFLKKLLPDAGPTELGLTLNPGVNEQLTIKKLHERLGLTVHSWKALYPALVSALKLEKYAMFLILALITLVASMNILSLMFMKITQKRTDIAILKTIGMSDNSITSCFLLLGFIIAFLGSLTGLLLAFIGGFILEHYRFITLPDAYYVTHLPSRMSPEIFITVFFVVMILSLVSTWVAARKTKKINISHVLRFEG